MIFAKNVFYLHQISMTQFNFLKISIFLFIISLTLHQVVVFEIIRNITIRISEVSFLILIIIFIIDTLKKKISIYQSKLDYILLLFIFLSFIHIIFFPNKSTLIGLIIFIYSYLIYVIFKNYFQNFGLKFIENTLIVCAVFAGFTSILGWVLIQLGINTNLVLTYDYPISIGEQGRSRGLFETPNSLFIFLVLPALLALQRLKDNYSIFNLTIFLIIFFGCFFTISKSNVILISLIIMFLSNYLNNKGLKKILHLSSIFLIITYFFLSHFLILDKNSKNFEKYTSTWFVSETYQPILEFKSYVVIPTNYIETKKKNLELFYKNPFLGNGFNSYTNFASEKVPHEKGKPHSTYLGYLSEFGILGLLILLISFSYIFRTTFKEKKKYYFLYLFALFILIEAFNSDLMTSRIIWIFFAYTEYISINNFINRNEAKKIHLFR